MTVYEDLRIERREAIGWIVIDRGDGRNALRPQSLREICAAVDELTADAEVRAIVLAWRS